MVWEKVPERSEQKYAPPSTVTIREFPLGMDPPMGWSR